MEHFGQTIHRSTSLSRLVRIRFVHCNYFRAKIFCERSETESFVLVLLRDDTQSHDKSEKELCRFSVAMVVLGCVQKAIAFVTVYSLSEAAEESAVKWASCLKHLKLQGGMSRAADLTSDHIQIKGRPIETYRNSVAMCNSGVSS